jgi:CRISPR-associated protein Csd1
MILQALHDLYQRLVEEPANSLPTPGYSLQDITFRVVIRSDGSLVEIQDLRRQNNTLDTKAKGKGKLSPTRLLVPGQARPSEASLEPCWLWDDTRFVFGWHGKKPVDARNVCCFEAFRASHLSKEKEIADPQFSAVCSFLRTWNPEQANQHKVLSDIQQGRVVFQVAGTKSYAHESPLFRAWWKRRSEAPEGERGQCLITGKYDRILARLHPSVSGIPGSPYTGAALVSFNSPAYESYGKQGKEVGQCHNAPVDRDAAFAYAAALNYLLGDRRRSFRIGDSTVVFWTERPTPAEFLLPCMMDAARAPEDEVLKARLSEIMEKMGRGQLSDDDLGDAHNRYYILGLSLNKGRLSVRFWNIGTLGELASNLQDHFTHLRIVREWDDTNSTNPDPLTPTVFQLVRQTVRDADSIPPLLVGALLRSILLRVRYPDSLINSVINRIRTVEKDKQGRSLANVTYLRAAILKAYLIRNHHREISPVLDENNTHPAYRLGRLFAVLEKTQKDALPGIKSTIRERFYSSASATPRAVFGRLLRTYPHHLAKLEGGWKTNRERLVQDILWPLDGKPLPAQLNLSDQSLFAIGYYHQRKALFSQPKPTNSQGSATAELIN